MARARNIKPGFFKNEDLAECSPWARLCFIGLSMLVDREGRMEDRPKRIKGELFAFDSIEVEPLLQELERRGFIMRYEVEGRGFIAMPTFLKHQNPHHREPPSEIPPPQSPGLNGDANLLKPEASPSSYDTKALDKPEASPGLLMDESDFHGTGTGLNPESLNPESLNPSPEAVGGEIRTPTPAGAVCLALKRSGIGKVSPGHPVLLALLEAGATVEEFEAFVPQSLSKGDPFSWLLTTLTEQRTKAAEVAKGLYRGKLPQQADTRQTEAEKLFERGNR